MNEQQVTHLIIRHYRPTFFYSERETLAASHMGIRTLRQIRASGLIEGKETEAGLRYSEEEVVQLRRIRRLQRDMGINMAGIEVIVHLLKHIEALQEELAQEKNQVLRREEKSDEH